MHRKIFSLVCMLGLPLAACDLRSAPAETIEVAEVLPELQGVWERAEIQIESGHNAGLHLLDVQPSVYIFSKTHYGVSAVEDFLARPFLPEEPTDADRGRALIPYSGEMGTYTHAGDKLTLSPVVTKDPAGMDGNVTHTFDIAWDGLDVWLTTTTPETGAIRTRLTRVDDDVRLATPDARRLAGVWKRVEMVIGAGPDAGTHIDDAQPGYYIFTPRSFVGNYVSAFAPRPPLPAKATDEDWGRNYASFVSFGGTFTLRENVLVLRATASQNPNNMQGRPFQAIDVTWEGEDSVWFVYTNSAGIQNRTRLVRVPD